MRRLISWFLNWWYRNRREKLPYCRNIEDVAERLKAVEYEADRTDWVKDPELTWGEKKGDCEDIARLAGYMIKPFAKSEIVDFICRNPKLNHSICKYSSGIFDNGVLTYTTQGYHELAWGYAGNYVKEIIIRDLDMNEIRRIKL